MSLTLLVAMAAATYRISRLLIRDKIFETWRDRFYGWLTAHPNRFTVWLQTLMMCPYCVTVWVAAGVVVGVDLFHHVSLIVLSWLAVATGALVFWAYIDDED